MGRKVLMIDNESVFLSAMKKILERGGYEVDIADNIDDAMNYLKANKYGVVITDIRLTGSLGEEGFEILRYIKHARPGTKTIVITGYGSREYRDRAGEIGADVFFEKPVPSSLLEVAIENCMEEHDGMAKV